MLELRREAVHLELVPLYEPVVLLTLHLELVAFVAHRRVLFLERAQLGARRLKGAPRHATAPSVQRSTRAARPLNGV